MFKKVCLMLGVLGVIVGAALIVEPAAVQASDEAKGDAANGKVLFERTCVACHGSKAEGNKDLNAPRLAGQEIWYMVRQLQNFKTGLRGANPRDIYGAQMRPMALTLANDQEILDVATYVNGLN